MVLLPGCPCCKSGPCWRCYGKTFGCDDLSFEVKYVRFYDMDEFLTVDTTEEKGLPIGTTFGPYQQTDSLPDRTDLDFLYVSQDKTSTQFGGRLTCNEVGNEDILVWDWFTEESYTGSPKVLLQYEDDFLNYSREGRIDDRGDGAVPKTPGEYPVFGVIRSLIINGNGYETVGYVEILVRVFDMNDAVPEEYQCFEAPPTEDGWTATGKCSATEEECEAECPPTTPPTGARNMTTTKTTGGPGTQLKNLLGYFGIQSNEKGCKCGHWQKKMDRFGPRWCRDHREEIMDHLAAEAKKRGLPFIRLAAEKLLELAIRRSEK